ncbi:MAG: class I SAM-dependent methyltransferase [Candidatus Nanoarchaeia archaeon]|nr:class I SAM-dependent methyltransferase [Candidatus Nanoarchaeia archaeon]
MKQEEIYKDIYADKLTKLVFRYRWIYEKFLFGFKNKKILELGCPGSGGIIQFLKNDNEVYGADISESSVKILKSKGFKSFLINLNEGTIPFKDKYFDDIIFIGTIEHLYNPQHGMEEVKRVLKTNGTLLISIPNPATGHYQIYPKLYTHKQFKIYLAKNGFKVRRFKKYGICFPFYNWFVKSSKVKGKVDTYVDNWVIGALVYLLSYIPRPKSFGWSWIYECTNLDKKNDSEEYMKDFTTLYK